ncbi:NADH dehydrogenase subunit 5 [Lysinibacillus yapensis]|uniref:Probable inorganic carbon transporter subunit DabB n=1 Tax=Ureibacillus yapensis TaxID=2304605 RepID=A0A396S2M7_9BACL|nr:NADH dehydrogenase subunit 5 [Lysinibacillus yapensis]RHW31381.1 NADH dehydrogenase subunit 5 [Lysinibacillus yapensis]
MLNQLDSDFLPFVFLLFLAVSVLSSLLLLYPKTPLHFIRIHQGFIVLPPLVALIALLLNDGKTMVGPWHFDSLSWLLALFVLTIGCIVQRYCVHYLLGDAAYREYFALLTFTTTAAAATWISNDLRLLLACWGAALLGLTLLIRLRKEWNVARNSAKICGFLFSLSWGALLVAIFWIAQSTNQWQLSAALTLDSLAKLDAWEKTCINLLLILAVVIPAGQWPFQRWLLDSVVAPTPISAVMHAGIVNAGGIILTLFAPLFNGSLAQIVLFIFSSISVVIGTGIMLVQVDYKRQLVGSTIAQMGFMLIQCALGAYLAAIMHAVLHGLFKATLFLQSGSAIQRHEYAFYTKQPLSFLSKLTGIGVGVLAGMGFWLASPGDAYQLVSAFILGWSLSIAWVQLVASGLGKVGRIAGFAVLVGGAIIYFFIHHLLYVALNESVQESMQPPVMAAIVLIVILLGAIMIGISLTRNRFSKFHAIIYLWLVRLGEPQNDVIESHPNYLTQLLFQGGKSR